MGPFYYPRTSRRQRRYRLYQGTPRVLRDEIAVAIRIAGLDNAAAKYDRAQAEAVACYHPALRQHKTVLFG